MLSQRYTENILSSTNEQQEAFTPTEFNGETKIYRIFSADRFIELLKTKKNTLVRPSMWDDPFENFLLKSKFLMHGEKVSLEIIANTYYAQCWSMTKESDAMWRIYSPNKRGVRVCTTVKSLFRPLWQSKDVKFKEISAFIGNVTYKNLEELNAIFSDPKKINSYIFDSSGKNSARSLLIKREEFSHENEVRIIYSESNSERKYTHGDHIFQYEIDPNSIFSELTLDPRIDDIGYFTIQAALEKAGWTGEISKSNLYAPHTLETIPEIGW